MRVRSPQPERLLCLLLRHGFAARAVAAGELQVEGTTIGELAGFAHFFHVPLHHLGAVPPAQIPSPRRGRRAGGGAPVRGRVAH